MTSGASIDWAEHSRELTLTCDRDGAITWLDPRAARALGAKPGDKLLDLAVPGTQSKTAKLLEMARREAVRDWETSLLANGRARTLCFCARPGDDGAVHLHAFVYPDDHGETVQQLTDALDEVVQLNRQIARQKKDLEQANATLKARTSDLKESNRGVLTLHSELADKADTLKRVADYRSRVVANVSHEFRTPLHTILGLSKLLLDSSDGPLTEEQKKQLRFIRGSAEELSALVNDLLDLSKAESGRALLRPERFSAHDFVTAIKGQLRPLELETQAVKLIFDEPKDDFELETDHGKLAQITRNLITNALKFTEKGEVRVQTRLHDGKLVLSVADTGIGISPEHFDRIFQEFGQIDSPVQRRVKGTGLGLPLSKKLAELLGGSLTVASTEGKGSTFTLTIPLAHPEVKELHALEERPLDPSKAPVLVVEDDRKTIFVYERYLAMAGFQVVPARNVDDARRLLKELRPAAVVLDVMLEGEATWTFLGQLKKDPQTRDIPVLVVTVTNNERKARALGADEFWLKPIDQDQLIRKLKALAKTGEAAKVLVIDDDDKVRYLMRKYLDGTPYLMLEAATGTEGIAQAQRERPDVILLDFLLDEMTAFDVLDALKGDPRTRGIPVVIITSHLLDAGERQRLAESTEATVSKESLSRELALHRIREALQKVGVSKRIDVDGGRA